MVVFNSIRKCTVIITQLYIYSKMSLVHNISLCSWFNWCYLKASEAEMIISIVSLFKLQEIQILDFLSGVRFQKNQMHVC